MSRKDLLFEVLSSSGTKDLLGHIDALLASSTDFVKARDRVLLSFVPLYPPISTYGDLGGFIRGMIRGSADLDAYIYGIGAVELLGRIKGLVPKDLDADIFGYAIKDLGLDISPIPSVPLFASIKALKYKYLLASIFGIPPVDLKGYIRGLHPSSSDLDASFASVGAFYDLLGSIVGVNSRDLSAYIRAYQHAELTASISGFYPADLYGTINSVYTSMLRASIQGKTFEAFSSVRARIRGLGQSYKNLASTIRAIAHTNSDLIGEFEAILPKELFGYIGINRPKDLYGIIYPARVRRAFDRLLIELGPTKDLIGAFNPYGRYKDLIGIIRGVGSRISSDLLATIDGFGQTDLEGYIYPQRWKSLYGSIYPKGIDTRADLVANFNVVFSSLLSGVITPNENTRTLDGYIAPSGASSVLSARIRPDVSAFHDVVVINTLMHKNLYGVIYSREACSKASAFGTLKGRIHPNFEGSDYLSGFVQPKPYNTLLYGSIVGGYSFPGTSDLYGTISSRGSYVGLSATISSPISYLKGAIIGTGTGYNDLAGEFKPFEWNVFLRGRITPRLLLPKSLNTISSQTYKKDSLSGSILRDIQIKFASQGYEYVRSDLASNTFLVNGDTWGVHLSKLVPKINPDGFMQDFVEEKVKVFFDISGFSSFDEAMRYFIDFIAYGARSNLSGTIYPRGGFSPLYARIIATSPDKLKNLEATVYPVDLDLVTLRGSITPKGGLLDMQAMIKSITRVESTLSGSIYGHAQTDLQGYINSV